MKLFDHNTILQEGDPILEILLKDKKRPCILSLPPTAEVIAENILDQFAIHMQVLSKDFQVSVKFWETEDSYVEVTS